MDVGRNVVTVEMGGRFWQRPQWRRWAIVGARILLGGVFLLAGFSKAIRPFEEFSAEIRAYDLLPSGLVDPTAIILPWLELVAGAFLALGLFPRAALAATTGMLGVFLVAVGSVIVRGIPLEDCGCFSGLGLPPETPPVAFIRNLVLLALAGLLWRSRRPLE